MRILWRLFLIIGAVAVAGTLAVVGTVVALYIPARSKISSALSNVPAGLRPPPAALVAAATCVHDRGVGRIVARKLLTAEGLDRSRAIVWTARYIVWTEAVDLLSADDAMALYADTLHHEVGVGLVSGARAYFSKGPPELTRAEALELVLADAYPTFAPADRLERLRRSCS